MSSRRFTEKEAAAIMRRAAENQSQTTDISRSEGISEVELRAAAKELGIESSAVDAALLAIEPGGQGSNSGIMGGPFRHEIERVFTGTVTDETWEAILADARRTFSETGVVEQRGKTREWSGTGGGTHKTIVTIRQIGNSIRVQVSSDFGDLAVVGYLLSILPFFVTIGFFSKIEWPLLWKVCIGTALTIVYLLVARGWTVNFSRKIDQRTARFIDRVEALAQTGPEVMLESAAPPETVPDISVDQDAKA